MYHDDAVLREYHSVCVNKATVLSAGPLGIGLRCCGSCVGIISRLPASLSWNIKKSVGEALLQNVIDLLRLFPTYHAMKQTGIISVRLLLYAAIDSLLRTSSDSSIDLTPKFILQCLGRIDWNLELESRGQ